MNLSRIHITDRLHTTEARWFALRTANRHEKMAAKLLQKDGIEYFLPLKEVHKQYRRKTVHRTSCLLPGYVFVRIVQSQQADIHRNPYVKFLKIGPQRLDIPQVEIEILRRIIGEKELELEWELKPLENWIAGQEVELIGGSLTGTQGTYVSKKNKGFLVISLGLLPAGMGLQTMVHESQVRPLGGRPSTH